jgi:hypothetical protein
MVEKLTGKTEVLDVQESGEPIDAVHLLYLCGSFTVPDDPEILLHSSGASQTLILRGLWTSPDHASTRAILKLGRKDDLGFLAERFYYAFVVRELRKQTPHVVTALAVNCPIDRFVFSHHAVRAAWAAARVPRAAVGLITRRAPGLTLDEVLKYHRLQWEAEEIKAFDLSVAVQLAQCLSVFGRSGFQHNDLHLDNIMCQPLGKPFVLPYKVHDQPWSVAWFLRIFDFDNATSQKWPNPDLPADRSVCRTQGMCDTFTPNYDWYYAWAHYSYALPRSDILDLVHVRFDFNRGRVGTRPCEAPPQEGIVCVPDAKTLRNVLPPDKFLAMHHTLDQNALEGLLHYNRTTFFG